MTTQYQEESINGQPSAQSFRVNPAGAAVPGGVSTEAFFWPTLAADAVIVGNAISIAGDAADGTIIEIAQPGLYAISFTVVDGGASGTPFNVVRGAVVDLTAGNGYPAIDYAAGTPLGAESVGIMPVAVPPSNKQVTVNVRISDADVTDTGGVVNPNRQIRFSALAAVIPAVLPLGTEIRIDRVSR